MNTSPIPSWTGKFSHREIEILNLISDGLSNREISQKLYLALDTVKWYNKHLFAKLGVNNRTQALNMARHYRLLQFQTDAREDAKPHLGGHLPAQVTSYVGYELEIAEIKDLLASSRLVTLTGAGGIGKTRLALQVAETLSASFPHGAWLVELASTTDPAQVVEAIAQVLKVTGSNDVTLAGAIKNYLSRKHLLLLLDNFEHLLDAAPFVTDLLSAAPRLFVLATSRERLRLYGEQEYPIRPLNLPDLRKKELPHDLVVYEAVDLFIQRARAAQPALNFDDANIIAAARICIRLDGLPLAIELAASQVKIYPPILLAQRLAQSLEGLPDAPRDLPARQRTLRATIAWSYNLLNQAEKSLMARMAVFSGGGILEAIRYICAFDLHGNIVAILSSLVDKNLLFVREGPESEPRFSMLQTIHEFAAQLLEASGESEVIHQYLVAYFADLAEQYEREIHGPRHMFWNWRMQAERGNLDTVLNRSLAEAQPVDGLRLIAGLTEHWFMNGTIEDSRWAEVALKRTEQVPLNLRAAVFQAIGEFYFYLGKRSIARKLLQDSIDIFHKIGDERNAAWSMSHLSAALFEGIEHLEACVILARQSLEIFRRYADKPGISKSLTSLGELARIKGDLETAKACYIESLAYSQQTGDRFRDSVQYNNLSFVAFRQGEYHQAMEYSLQGLKIMLEMDIPDASAFLFSLAGPLSVLGNPEKAARLLGAAQAQLDTAGVELQAADLQDAQSITAATRQALDDEVFQQAWQVGYNITTRQALVYALDLV
jgi:predicted ATPase/DNA-binding CsgD family transcriptional regulator